MARGRRLRLLVSLAAAIGVAVLAVTAFNGISRQSENVLAAAGARISSVVAFEDDISAQHRISEWEEARRLIESNPLRGIGLGNTLTFYSPLYDPETARPGGYVTNTYVHNSYVWIPLKLGLPALVMFAALIVVVLIRSFRSSRTLAGRRARTLMVGGLASLTSLLVLATVGPHLNTESATPYLAAVIAVLLVVPRLDREERTG
jgi:O-antigen ligase